MVKHLYGASFVSKLFFSVVSYIIVLFVYLSSPIWYHLLLTFHTSLFDIWRSERDCRLNVYSVGWTHYSVHSTHYSVGCRHYSIGCTLYSVGCICRLYALLCRLGTMHYWSVICKHILCRLYTLLCRLCTTLGQLQTYTVGCTQNSDHSRFLGKSLKKAR